MEMALNLTSKVGENCVSENLLVSRLAENRFRVVRSPGIVQGLAADDEFEVDKNSDQGYRLVRRGGNVCVQFFFPANLADCRSRMVPLAEKIGGRLDGGFEVNGNSGGMVFTFPISVGFAAIEEFAVSADDLCNNREWYYGNVYDSSDGITPLNWWK